MKSRILPQSKFNILVFFLLLTFGIAATWVEVPYGSANVLGELRGIDVFCIVTPGGPTAVGLDPNVPLPVGTLIMPLPAIIPLVPAVRGTLICWAEVGAKLTVWRGPPGPALAGRTVILELAELGCKVPPILMVGPLGAGGAAVIFCGLPPGGVMVTCL